jgi:hypothetical protein
MAPRLNVTTRAAAIGRSDAALATITAQHRTEGARVMAPNTGAIARARCQRQSRAGGHRD